ncbi:MAG: hypothetical protein KIS74_09515 [Burkholderiales bacterium]|nr:hypothetical protein [Burkholderiales bacterium]
MEQQDKTRAAADVTATRARQGITPGVVRYVLSVSLVLAVVALVLTFVLTR